MDESRQRGCPNDLATRVAEWRPGEWLRRPCLHRHRRELLRAEGVYDEIKRRFGGMKFADFQESVIDEQWHDRALDALLREIPRKTAIAQWLMESEQLRLLHAPLRRVRHGLASLLDVS